MCVLLDKFYASSTGRSNRFLNPELIFISSFSNSLKSFIIMWEDISFGYKVIVFWKDSFHFFDAFPEFIFSAHMPASSKMIKSFMRLDLGANSFDLTSSNIKEHIPIFSQSFFISIRLEGIHDTPILGSIDFIFEIDERNFIKGIFISFVLELAILRIEEVDGRGSSRKLTFFECCNFIVVELHFCIISLFFR